MSKSAPRQKKLNPSAPRNRTRRHEAKKKALGICITCTKPSTPYTRCADHRAYAKILHAKKLLANKNGCHVSEVSQEVAALYAILQAGGSYVQQCNSGKK